MIFEFTTATRIIFGPGTIHDIVPLAAEMGSRAFIVTGRTPQRAKTLLVSRLTCLVSQLKLQQKLP
ncbi:MAG: hypothetical protein ACYS8Y_04510 [Planctomycetota bacterium]|jgi:alcohol dehydrogenase class IV